MNYLSYYFTNRQFLQFWYCVNVTADIKNVLNAGQMADLKKALQAIKATPGPRGQGQVQLSQVRFYAISSARLSKRTNLETK